MARGAPIWYRQILSPGNGRVQLLPGVFERYGAIRVAIIVESMGRQHRIYVSPCNVYERREGDTP